MIISPQRRYIFVHVPKTGGTALAQALETRAMKDDILVGDTPKAIKRRKRLAGLQPKGRLWKHSTLRDVEGVVDPTGYFVVTLTRNPWDRVVSYYHWLRAQHFDHPAVTLAKRADFSGFLNDPATLASLRAHPIASYTTDSFGQDHATLVARLEYLDADLAPFWDHLGFALSIAQVNSSQRDRDYRTYYSDGDAALIETICRQDIAAKGYVFDPSV